MYAVEFTPRALKEFGKLDGATQERITAALDRIRVRPYDFVEKLSGSPLYKLRVGEYRVIMSIESNRLIVLVVHVGHRKNVYKPLVF
jgi:mRNA interferase RelE/StbE